MAKKPKPKREGPVAFWNALPKCEQVKIIRKAIYQHYVAKTQGAR